jgi:penicillin-binding protein 2
MNNGLMNLDTKVKDEGVWTRLENFYPKCLLYSSVYATHGEIECKFALEVSCNYFFYELGHWLTIEQLDETAKGFGLGEPTGVELPEITGHRSNRESKAAEYTGLSAQWFPGDRILTAIGQAENRFTPMQLCVYASTLANKGTRMKATFLNRVVSADYRSLVLENEPQVASTMEVCNDAYLGYMEGMRRVITGTLGTARKYFDGLDNTRFRWPRDIVVWAKTGTAQTFKNVSDNGAFVCFAARKGGEPEIAIALYGEKVAHPTNLVPVAEAIVNTYFSRYQTSNAPTNENRIG